MRRPAALTCLAAVAAACVLAQPAAAANRCVAHYGLMPDLLALMARQPRGAEALTALFGSAEAYLRTWERAAAGGS